VSPDENALDCNKRQKSPPTSPRGVANKSVRGDRQNATRGFRELNVAGGGIENRISQKTTIDKHFSGGGETKKKRPTKEREVKRQNVAKKQKLKNPQTWEPVKQRRGQHGMETRKTKKDEQPRGLGTGGGKAKQEENQGGTRE